MLAMTRYGKLDGAFTGGSSLEFCEVDREVDDGELVVLPDREMRWKRAEILSR